MSLSNFNVCNFYVIFSIKLKNLLMKIFFTFLSFLIKVFLHCFYSKNVIQSFGAIGFDMFYVDFLELVEKTYEQFFSSGYK